MLRDRDTIYGESFIRCIASMGIREVRMAPRAPWQNAFVERVIGSIRRECLDHVIIRSEAHLGRVLRAYLAYYNATRPHQSLDNNSPHPRVVARQPCSRIIAIPQVGGLHHRYRRVA
jgi:putative transposase